MAGTALATANAFQRERLTAEEQTRAARTDPLTGLANRRQANQLLTALSPGDSLALVDMDHFRDVNERLGHEGGDKVLTDFAGHLIGGVRAGEVVARYGGEEFLLILPRCPAAEAVRVLDRLLATWRATDPPTTFSAGVAMHEAGHVGGGHAPSRRHRPLRRQARRP